MFNLSSFNPNSVKQISLKWLVVGGLVLFIGGLAAGRFATPAKVETKTEIQIVEKEKIVEKIVYIKDTNENSKENTNTKQQIHIVEKTSPDGTYTKETFILNEDTKYVEVDKSTHEGQTTDKTTEKEKIVDVTKDKTVTSAVAEWRLSGMAGLNYDKAYDLKLKDSLVYGGIVEKRVIGPVYMGGWGTTSKEVGLSIGLQF
jgi:hypothetical protein